MKTQSKSLLIVVPQLLFLPAISQLVKQQPLAHQVKYAVLPVIPKQIRGCAERENPHFITNYDVALYREKVKGKNYTQICSLIRNVFKPDSGYSFPN